jgi:hypothetical protein
MISFVNHWIFSTDLRGSKRKTQKEGRGCVYVCKIKTSKKCFHSNETTMAAEQCPTTYAIGRAVKVGREIIYGRLNVVSKS